MWHSQMAALALQSHLWYESYPQSSAASSYPAAEHPASPETPRATQTHPSAHPSNSHFGNSPRVLSQLWLTVWHPRHPPSNTGALQMGRERTLGTPPKSACTWHKQAPCFGGWMFTCPCLIHLQQQFPGHITDTKCRPAAKPSNIITRVQKLQLPDRNLSFIEEQTSYKLTILHNLLPIPADAGSTNKCPFF